MNLWWPIIISTVVLLVLGLGFIGVYLAHQRERTRLLVSSEQRYADLFNNVSDILYVHSADGTIEQINRTAADVFGLPPEKLVGKNISEFISPAYLPMLRDYLEACAGSSGEISGIFPIIHRSTGRIIFLEYRSSGIVRNGGAAASGVRGVARDVTRQKHTERSLRRERAKVELLLQQSRTIQGRLEFLSREIFRIQELERQKISRELHDELGQHLVAVNMNIDIINSKLPVQDAVIRKLIGETREMMEVVFRHVQNYLRDLRPIGLDELGLVPSIRHLAGQLSSRFGVKIHVFATTALEELNEEQKITVYRVVQESCMNALKHAAPSSVAIMIDSSDHEAEITVQDDGSGFRYERSHAQPTTRGAGLGLMGSEERVKLLRGAYQVESQLGLGTTIRVTLPLREADGPIPS